MPEYAVLVAPAAERDFKKLDRGIIQRIKPRLESLRTEPRPHGVEKLKDNPRFWRLRVGDYRVIYTIDDKKHDVIILRVRKRGDCYRDLGNLELVRAAFEELRAANDDRRPAAAPSG